MASTPISTRRNRITNSSVRTSRDDSGETFLNTTTVDTAGETTIQDVSIIPFMRELDIDLIAYNMRPNREVFLYMEDKEMSHFFQNANKITLDTKKAFGDAFNTPREFIDLNGGNAHVFLAETNQTTGNTTLYVGHFEDITTNVVTGNTVTGKTTGLLGNVVSYTHASGLLRAGSTTSSLYLGLDAEAGVANNYVGNTISIVTGVAAGQTSNITEYNAATRLATVSPALGSTPNTGDIYSIGDSRSPYSANARPSIYTTSLGFITGTLHLPDPSENSAYSFRTGDRVIRFIDNRRNDLTDYTTRSEYNFTSSGLQITSAQIINREITQNVTRSDNNNRGSDPTAQSFYIAPDIYEEGVFVSSISVYFKNKGSLPIEMQVRPMESGLPSSSKIVDGASVILTPDAIVATESPNTSNSASATTFTFPAPIYLAPDKEYAFCLITNDYDYDVWVAELGEKILGTDRIVSTQPYLGSMFKSQNARTWTPLQDETVMFQINKCVFDTSGSFVFNDYKGSGAVKVDANAVFDLFQFQVDATELPGTSLTWKYKTTTNANSTLEQVYNQYRPERNIFVGERKVAYSSDVPTKSLYTQVTMATTNPDVSPVVFHNRAQMVTIENIIGNMGITNSLISIANTGTGYTAANTWITFTSPTGTGANAYIGTANATTGAIESVIVDEAGVGYYDNVTITVGSTDGSNANLVFTGETSKSGGPALVRYITKTIGLRDGYDAGDLRVYVDAVKPAQANVQVYYKVRNSLDSETIDDKNWVKMTQYGDTYVYSTNYVPVEYEFRPSATANAITYSTATATYKTFNEFKLKIVMASTDTVPSKIPISVDIRAIAMPADIF